MKIAFRIPFDCETFHRLKFVLGIKIACGKWHEICIQQAGMDIARGKWHKICIQSNGMMFAMTGMAWYLHIRQWHDYCER